jgi:hypothetical protein
MASQICPHCGGNNPPGASFCQFCGSAFTPSTSAPLPTGVPSVPTPYQAPPAAWGGGGPPPPAPRRRSRLLVIVVVIVVVILVLGVVAYFTTPPPPGIQINSINVDSVDNVCGLDGASASGFAANTTDQVPLSFNVTGASAPNGGTYGCTIETVTTSTPGFSLFNVSEPLIVPANETVILSFTVQCPNSDYTGVLTLVMT